MRDGCYAIEVIPGNEPKKSLRDFCYKSLVIGLRLERYSFEEKI